jgi:hypothetical protein
LYQQMLNWSPANAQTTGNKTHTFLRRLPSQRSTYYITVCTNHRCLPFVPTFYTAPANSVFIHLTLLAEYGTIIKIKLQP